MATAELELGQEEVKAEIRRLFENAPFGFALCHRQGTLTALNSAFEEMLGFPCGTVRSPQLADLTHAQDSAEVERLFFELLAGKRESVQIACRTAGPHCRPLRWTGWRIPGSGAAGSVLALVEEVPAPLVAEQRLRQTERLEIVGRLAGGVAHDFNNLLTGILLYCDLLAASIEPEHRAHKYAEEVRKAALQATGLVRQLLVIARPPNFQPRPLSLNEIAEGMHDLLVRLIGEKIELKVNLDSNLGLVKIDATQAQQIFLNLVLNARDAMPRGGEIVVETRNCQVQVLTESAAGSGAAARMPCALLVVADNGEGMDDSTRAHLFEPFFTTKAIKGTGLGLATVYDIVTTNGGLLHIESQLSAGTRISVLLPLVPQVVVDARIASGFHPVSDGEGPSLKEEDGTP